MTRRIRRVSIASINNRKDGVLGMGGLFVVGLFASLVATAATPAATQMHASRSVPNVDRLVDASDGALTRRHDLTRHLGENTLFAGDPDETPVPTQITMPPVVVRQKGGRHAPVRRACRRAASHLGAQTLSNIAPANGAAVGRFTPYGGC